jgi:hypothetical protein
MENTIENVLRFIFETEATPLQKWFDKNRFYCHWSMYALNGRPINDRCVVNMDICHYTEPLISGPVFGYNSTAYVFPIHPAYVELTLESRVDKITIGKLYTDEDVHKRYIKRAVIAATVFFFETDFPIKEAIEIKYLDMSKPDDIFMLNQLVDVWCAEGEEQFFLDYCDKLSLMEHKMLVMREINEYRKANVCNDILEL